LGLSRGVGKNINGAFSKIRGKQKCMLKEFFWGPVGKKNAVAGHVIFLPPPHKNFIEHTFPPYLSYVPM